MKNTMQPMNQNQNEQQNDAFHKINAASQVTFSFFKLAILVFVMLIFFIVSSLMLFYAAGTADEVKGVFFGHTFSLYYLFQKFFDSLSFTFYSILPVDGMFYERCLRTLPGILLILYCTFAYPIYKKIHPKTTEIKVSVEDKYATEDIMNALSVVTSIMICAMACDRSLQGSFLRNYIDSVPEFMPFRNILPCFFFSIPVFIVAFTLCKFFFKTANLIYLNRDVKSAAIAVIIVLALIILWLIFNTIYLFIKQFIWIVVVAILFDIIEKMDFIFILK